MKNFFIWLLRKPIMWLAGKFSSNPKKDKVFQSLTKLYSNILNGETGWGPVIDIDTATTRIIIFSDQHKGGKNGADDFWVAEKNYTTALQYYYDAGFTFINLGDCEELWENNVWKVKKNNALAFTAEKKFADRKQLIKIFGNHDLFWDSDPFAFLQLESIYGQRIKVYEGVVLAMQYNDAPAYIFCTHGHQGDKHSDGNTFSKFFVSNIWGPLQAYLGINANGPSDNKQLKSLHNEMMYEWSINNPATILVTGHTHQPVFQSLTALERLYKALQAVPAASGEAKKIRGLINIREKEVASVAVDYLQMKPSYFNTGCCCYSDGDITGIEIVDGNINLIKWTTTDGRPQRELLETALLNNILEKL